MSLAGWLKPAFQGIQSTQIGMRDLLLGVVRGPILLEENRILRAQLQTLQAHEQTHRDLFEENKRLRALLGMKSASSWKWFPAEVVGREQGLWSRTLLPDRGAREGIKAGMAVVTPEGLVGRVSEAGPAVSRVILVTDPHFRVEAVMSPSRVSGLVAGNTSGDCLLTYVPKETQIKAGEGVLTAGGKSFCPEGVAIGVIRSVSKDPSELFQVARIRPAVDLSAVDEVLVLRSREE